MKIADLSQFNLPDAPGVYFFYGSKKQLLYVGKATSLKDRVKSYFARDILLTRGPKIVKMLEDAERVEFVQTDSVLEALILEANQIKKHQPPANSRDKDDKSYNYVVVTHEDFPKILVERGKNLGMVKEKVLKTFGPFPHAGELREALKIIRKIFPYRDNKCKLGGRPCFNAQIGLCSGPCAGWITKAEYGKIIRNFSLFFEGKKNKVIQNLEKEMKALAKKHEFEEAEKIKRKIFSLDHIQDVALIKADLARRNFGGLTLSSGAPTPTEISSSQFRIEAYDIAHISGTHAVGVMTVVSDGELDKSQYRKFKIKVDKNDDTKNLKEIVDRRLNHPEWPMPQLMAIDGGMGQLNAVKDVLKSRGLEIEVVSVVKDERHKAKEILNLKDKTLERAILLANSEAHRFAISYHRKLRSKGFRI